jgi:hypothetical protein
MQIIIIFQMYFPEGVRLGILKIPQPTKRVPLGTISKNFFGVLLWNISELMREQTC